MSSWSRYVALGDSSTEGLDDPDGQGGYRGWADRFAEHVASAASPDLLYANLAVRGRLAAQVRQDQLPRALELQPDLATVFAGVNDLLRPSFDADAVGADLEAVLAALVDAGATVLTITTPDPGWVMPLVRPLRSRVAALNDRVREAARRTGALVADVGATQVASDPRMWSADRLHANSLGHERIAAALAEALGLPGADHTWAEPLDAAGRRRPDHVVRDEVLWWGRHLAPWVLRRARGQSQGDGVTAKRLTLGPLA